MRSTTVDYDTLAAAYAAQRRVHPLVVDALARSGIGANSLVLDVGCGSGNYVAALSSQTGARFVGIDVSIEMLAEGRRRRAPSSVGIGRAEALPVAGGLFDVVYSVDVIHHVADRPAHFREAQRVLKAGGRVCTVTDSEDDVADRCLRLRPGDAEAGRGPGPRSAARTVALHATTTSLDEFRNAIYFAARDLRLLTRQVEGRPVHFVISGNGWRFADSELADQAAAIFKAELVLRGLHPVLRRAPAAPARETQSPPASRPARQAARSCTPRTATPPGRAGRSAGGRARPHALARAACHGCVNALRCGERAGARRRRPNRPRRRARAEGLALTSALAARHPGG